MTTTVEASANVGKPTRTAWVLTSLQIVNVIWFGVCVWAALARAAHTVASLVLLITPAGRSITGWVFD